MNEFEPLNLSDDGLAQPKNGDSPDATEPPTPPSFDLPTPEETAVDAEAPEAPEPAAFEPQDTVPLDSAPNEAAVPAENLQLLSQLLDATTTISQRLDDLSETFKTKIMFSEHEEKIVDEMHKELQKYKEDMYAQLVRPILLDIIEVRDSIIRIGAVYRAKPDGQQDIPNKTFSDYALDLQDILEKNNIEIYQSSRGGRYVPVRQRVVKKVATTDQALHGMIEESLSCGYSYNGRTISPEKVIVYIYEQPANNEKK